MTLLVVQEVKGSIIWNATISRGKDRQESRILFGFINPKSGGLEGGGLIKPTLYKSHKSGGG